MARKIFSRGPGPNPPIPNPAPRHHLSTVPDASAILNYEFSVLNSPPTARAEQV